jgi:fibronectin-binding autotransporter adhesin
MGSSLATYGTDFDMSQRLNTDGTLSATAKSEIASQAATMAASGLKLNVFMGPTVGNTDASYEYATHGNINVSQWAAAVTAYKNYWQSLGYTVSDVTPFNEPDYWSGQGSAAQLAQLMQLLRDDPSWKGTKLQGGTTLNAGNAQTWYTPLIGITDAGSSHLLGGSLSNYDTFAQSVVSSGAPFAAPELHSLGEAIVSANYNASEAAWWLDPLLARGTFSQASAGKRLGYSVNFNQETAAAVYRGTDGSTYAFAGGLERSGGPDTYRFVSSDRPMYVNGIGPISSYTMQADSDVDTAVSSDSSGSFGSYFDQGAMAKIDYGAASMPALDGYRWEIQNVQTGQLLNVSGGTGDNALINTAAATGSASQMWDITRIEDGYLTFFNTNSGRVAAVSGATQAAGGSVIQYDSVSSLDQQWDLVSAGSGTYYIQDGNSAYYLTGSSTNATQQALASGSAAAAQQWRFISVNPTRAAKANYALNGNANDATGNYNGTVSGTATYTTGPKAGTGALVLDGSSTYVTLPSAVSSTVAGIAANYSSGFTLDTWVNWNGGNAFQRIFDFGTGTNAYMYLTPSSSDGTMRFGITSAGAEEEEDVDTDALQTNQWVNVAVTLGGHSAIIYINGKPVAAGSVLINPTYVNATNDFIGKSQFSGDPLFSGSISQFSIYDYALTPTQVDDLLNNNLVWTGGQNGNTWDAATTSNFKLVSTSAASVYSQGDRVTFDGTGTGTVNLSGALSPFSVTVSSSSAVTFAGAGSITGSTSLLKTGTGALTVNTTNTFTGGTSVSGGTILMANAAALGTGGIDLVTGGTLTTTSYSSGAPTISNTIYGDGGSVAAAAATTLTLAGNIAGSGALTLTSNGTGVLQLTGNNSTFAGNAIVAGSNVQLASSTAGSGAATWTVNTALQLAVAGGATYQLGALAGAGTVASIAVNAAPTESTLTVGGAGTTAVFSGQIANNAGTGTNNVVGLTMAGTGTQVLSGSNTYTGPTMISSGTLVLGNGWTTGSIPLASALSDNGMLGFNHSNSLNEGVDFNAITGSGALLQAGTGTVYLGGSNTYSGGTTITAGALSISDDANIGANGSPITLNGGTMATTAYVYDTHPFTIGTNGGTINVQTNGQYFFNIYNLLRGYGALTLTGNGTLTQNVGNLRLNQGNTYSGALTIQQGGILEYGASGAIGSGASVTLGNQGELAVQGGSATSMPNSLAVTGGTNSVLSFENGTLGAYTGAITLNAGLTVGLRDWYNYANVRSGAISGVISGSGGVTINSGTGAGGALTLSAANTFTGNVTVNGSTLDAAFGANVLSPTSSALGNPSVASTVTINNGSTVAFTVGNVLGSGGSTAAPAQSFVVNQGGVLQTATSAVGTVASGNTGQGDANIFGNITLNGGTFTTGNGYNAPYQSAILLGTLTTGGTASSTISTNATNTVANGVMLATSGGITFNVGATGGTRADLTVSVPLVDAPGGAGSLIKSGLGTMLLTTTNTFTGTTTISAGMLAGTGTITSATSVQASATLAPGTPGETATGTFTTGAVTFANSSKLSVRLSSSTATADELNSSGTVSLGDGTSTFALLSVTDLANTTLPSGVVFPIIVAQWGVTGTFSGLPEGASIAVGVNDFKIDYTAYSDTTVTLTSAVPEPASLGLLGLGGVLMLRRRRRMTPRRSVMVPNFQQI